MPAPGPRLDEADRDLDIRWPDPARREAVELPELDVRLDRQETGNVIAIARVALDGGGDTALGLGLVLGRRKLQRVDGERAFAPDPPIGDADSEDEDRAKSDQVRNRIVDPEGVRQEPQQRDAGHEEREVEAEEPHVSARDRSVRTTVGEDPGLCSQEVPARRAERREDRGREVVDARGLREITRIAWFTRMPDAPTRANCVQSLMRRRMCGRSALGSRRSWLFVVMMRALSYRWSVTRSDQCFSPGAWCRPRLACVRIGFGAPPSGGRPRLRRLRR